MIWRNYVTVTLCIDSSAESGRVILSGELSQCAGLSGTTDALPQFSPSKLTAQRRNDAEWRNRAAAAAASAAAGGDDIAHLSEMWRDRRRRYRSTENCHFHLGVVNRHKTSQLAVANRFGSQLGAMSWRLYVRQPVSRHDIVKLRHNQRRQNRNEIKLEFRSSCLNDFSCRPLRQ